MRAEAFTSPALLTRRRILRAAILTWTACLTSCGPPNPSPAPTAGPAPPTAPPPSTVPAAASPAPPPSRPPSSANLNDVPIELITRLPVRCNPAQTNTPCIYTSGAACKRRDANCENMPCTEGAHEPVDCAAWVPGLAAPTDVCLELRELPIPARVELRRDGSLSTSGTGPLDVPVARLCGQADRFWRANLDLGSGAVVDLDWTKSDCIAIDLSAPTTPQPCSDGFTDTPYDNRL